MGSSEWSGDMLDRPEMVEAFAAQLRRAMSEYADYVARIRRDAEAMWRENPPAEYSTFEAWWRHHKVTAPFAEIQQHLEAAAALTFRLEARYRRHRHEIPDRRQAEARRREQRALDGGQEPAPSPRPAARAAEESSFLDMIQRGGRRSA
ncbi:hypothetical protein ACQEUU_37765 [Nonomuraea sp. CA-218870]|uniref:hypothetical protein n=1 Tax=Nonomuraea sp. CA-218870 TaxID=3239998 RepID=UPI003D8B21C6